MVTILNYETYSVLEMYLKLVANVP
jgi:hypothetical protein